MPTQTPSNVPWYLQKAERPKTNKTFFIYKEHSAILDRDYKGYSSALCRFLMDAFFDGKHPELVKEYKDASNKK